MKQQNASFRVACPKGRSKLSKVMKKTTEQKNKRVPDVSEAEKSEKYFIIDVGRRETTPLGPNTIQFPKRHTPVLDLTQ